MDAVVALWAVLFFFWVLAVIGPEERSVSSPRLVVMTAVAIIGYGWALGLVLAGDVGVAAAAGACALVGYGWSIAWQFRRRWRR